MPPSISTEPRISDSTAGYPVAGLLYFLAHPRLWKRIFCGILLLFFFGIVCTIVLFIAAFPAQAFALIKYTTIPPWASWLISFLLTIIEIGIAILIFTAIFLAEYCDRLFDDVLQLQGYRFPEARALLQQSNTSCLRGCWSGLRHCFLSTFFMIFTRVILLIILAPLHLIPIVGSMLFSYMNGYLYAWSMHLHYFDLKAWGFQRGKSFVYRNRSAYTNFGAAAIGLEMIPILNFLTPFTNVIGSALWAVEMEMAQGRGQDERGPIRFGGPRGDDSGSEQGLISPELDDRHTPEDKPSIDSEADLGAPPSYEEATGILGYDGEGHSSTSRPRR